MPQLFNFSAESLRVFTETKLSPSYIEALKFPVCWMVTYRIQATDVPIETKLLNDVARAARRLRQALNAVNRQAGAGASAGFVLEEQLMLREPECEADADIILDGRRVRAAIDQVNLLVDAAEEGADDALPIMFGTRSKGRPKAVNFLPSIYRALEGVWLSERGAREQATERPSFLRLRHGSCDFRRIADACYEEAGLSPNVPEKAYELFVSSMLAKQRKTVDSQ